MRELLIRYLLGELEPHEHEAVQRQLAESAELRRELARLRECFAPPHDSEEFADEPPRGLAERTAERVHESDSYDSLPTLLGASGAGFSDHVDTPPGRLGWSLADLTVAGGVILAVSMLLFPALRESHDGTRRVQCQHNQQQLGRLILTFAENNGGIIPPIHPGENAGSFTMQLVAMHYISPEDLKPLLVCPSAPEAKLIRAGQASIKLPSHEDLRAMPEAMRQEYVEWMSPMYAYRFGYLVGDQQYHIVSTRGARTPILSDAPGDGADGMSPNHCGSLVQVLFSDGSVKIFTTLKLHGGDDDLFRNQAGNVDAGLGPQDFVLGPSEASPKVFMIGAPSHQTPRLPWQPSNHQRRVMLSN